MITSMDCEDPFFLCIVWNFIRSGKKKKILFPLTKSRPGMFEQEVHKTMYES